MAFLSAFSSCSGPPTHATSPAGPRTFARVSPGRRGRSDQPDHASDAGEQQALAQHHAVTQPDDYSELRWTVDTHDDLDLVRRLYEELELDAHPRGYREILAHVLARPELQYMNQHILQKAA